MSTLELVYRKSENIVGRQIGDEAILVPIRKKSGDLDNVYTLNEVAADVWNSIDGRNSLKVIIDLVVDDYEVDHSKAESDVLQLVSHLEDIEAVSV